MRAARKKAAPAVADHLFAEPPRAWWREPVTGWPQSIEIQSVVTGERVRVWLAGGFIEVLEEGTKQDD